MKKLFFVLLLVGFCYSLMCSENNNAQKTQKCKQCFYMKTDGGSPLIKECEKCASETADRSDNLIYGVCNDKIYVGTIISVIKEKKKNETK